MPYKNYQDKLTYTKNWWKKHPEKYKQHLLKCSENRRLKKQ